MQRSARLADGGTWEKAVLSDVSADREARFSELFRTHFHRVFRILDRLSGDPDLAADLAQEAFVRLYRRRSAPDSPEGWLISVAMNLFRNTKLTAARRGRLLTITRAQSAQSDSARTPEELTAALDEQGRVRAALGSLGERERQLLLLRAEGYSYRDLAAALQLNEASVGTLLARARGAFRASYEGMFDAP